MEARSAPFFGTGPVSPRPAPRRLRPAWTRPGGGYEVELRTAQEIGADLAAWRALADRSVEPALFADPDVLLPALQHLPDGRQVSLILVWQPAAPARVLRGPFPVAMPRIPLAPGEVRLWRPAGFPVCAALLDSERPAAVLAAVLSFCAARGQRCAGLAATALPAEGPLAESLRTVAAASRRRLERLSPRHDVATATAFVTDEWPSRDPQLRLAQARTPGQVRDAVETFLVLDAAAAKERRTAGADPGCRHRELHPHHDASARAARALPRRPPAAAAPSRSPPRSCSRAPRRSGSGAPPAATARRRSLLAAPPRGRAGPASA